MDESKLIELFSKTDTSTFPDFEELNTLLERSLWILWVSKEKLEIKRLTAEQIALIMREIKEISIDSKSVVASFNKAGDKIHIHNREENGKVYYEIMKPGKDYLSDHLKEGSVSVFYFEPGKKYTSKSILSKKILENLKGELSIVDPYCSERTLDLLNKTKENTRLLTRLDNLKATEKVRFLRELKDFKTEHPNMEFKDYQNKDIHDRYIISTESLIILGHSIKDLGGKESFAISLAKSANKDLVEMLINNFDDRWSKSTPL